MYVILSIFYYEFFVPQYASFYCMSLIFKEDYENARLFEVNHGFFSIIRQVWTL